MLAIDNDPERQLYTLVDTYRRNEVAFGTIRPLHLQTSRLAGYDVAESGYEIHLRVDSEYTKRIK